MVRQNDDQTLPLTPMPAGLSDEKPRVSAAMDAYLQELENGQVPDRVKFLARFPEIAQQLERQLETLELLHGVVPQVVGDRSEPTLAGDEWLSKQESLGDFRLIRQIGRGGMGVVYEAEQRSLGRRVAVKVLPFAAMLDDQHRKRFYNEARAAATLDHPHIVPVYFVGQERGVHFFAMHLIEGQSLAELIEGLRGDVGERTAIVKGRESLSLRESRALRPGEGGTPFPPRPLPRPTLPREGEKNSETAPNFHSRMSTQRTGDRGRFFQTVARLGAEAAEALEHAHQVGILHRDIKPGNLLIDRSGKLWVADFGLASSEHGETLTRTGGVIGTAAYMSPEQALAAQHIDGRSDVYSLGATLYELLTLRRYRPDRAIRSGMIGGVDNDVTTLSRVDATIPVDLETIVIKALAVAPSDRYQSAGAMADDLRAFIAGREIQARRLNFIQRQARWLQHHQRLAAAALVGSFLLVTFIAVATLLHSNQLQSVLNEKELALTSAEQSRLRAEQSEQSARLSEQSAQQSELLA